MKKLLALLLALVVVGGAFAQATVNGYVRAIGTYTEDAFSMAERLRLNLGWTSEDGNVKFGSRLESTFAKAQLDVKYAYGQIKLADGMVVVNGGMLTLGTYEFASGMSDYNLGNVANGGSWWAKKGMAVQVLPMEGLNIGVLAQPDGGKARGEQFNVGVAYTLEGIGDFLAHVDFADTFDTSAVTAGFKYTGVEGLGITAGYKGLEETSVFGIVNYDMDALSAELAGEFNLDTENIYFETSLKYTMGDLVLLGLVGYDKDGAILGTVAPTEVPPVDEPSTYFVGAEIMYNLGKGQIAINPSFDDFKGFSLPVVVKVAF